MILSHSFELLLLLYLLFPPFAPNVWCSFTLQIVRKLHLWTAWISTSFSIQLYTSTGHLPRNCTPPQRQQKKITGDLNCCWRTICELSSPTFQWFAFLGAVTRKVTRVREKVLNLFYFIPMPNSSGEGKTVRQNVSSPLRELLYRKANKGKYLSVADAAEEVRGWGVGGGKVREWHTASSSNLSNFFLPFHLLISNISSSLSRVN